MPGSPSIRQALDFEDRRQAFARLQAAFDQSFEAQKIQLENGIGARVEHLAGITEALTSAQKHGVEMATAIKKYARTDMRMFRLLKTEIARNAERVRRMESLLAEAAR